MTIPNNLYYTKDHEWIAIDGNIGTIGITEFAQSALGDIVYVEIDKLNQNVNKDECFGTIEAVKTVSDLFSPMSGIIITFNETLIDNPHFINQDPYQTGWICKINFSNFSELEQLLRLEDYENLINH